MKTIGISINISQADFSLWTNGHRQNLFFLATTLRLSGLFDVVMVDYGTTERVPLTDKLPWDLNKYKTVRYADVKDSLDLIITAGVELATEDGYYLRRRGCKIVNFVIGFRYVTDMEDILFTPGKGFRCEDGFVDEVWTLPHHANTSYYYLETLYKTRVRLMPNIWGPEFIEKEIANQPNRCGYVPKAGPKRLACFEPNMDVVKFSMYNILIAERVYETAPEHIRHMYVTNALKLAKSERFVSIVSKLKIVRDKKVSFEDRYRLPGFLSKYTDVVVAHQWENSFNYAYIDTLYLGYPMVHNAGYFKDAGYYYEGFNVAQGAEQLRLALEHHDENMDDYKRRSVEVLKGFLCDNPTNVDCYTRAVLELLR